MEITEHYTAKQFRGDFKSLTDIIESFKFRQHDNLQVKLFFKDNSNYINKVQFKFESSLNNKIIKINIHNGNWVIQIDENHYRTEIDKIFKTKYQ